jgi:hypothetical protein
MCLGRTGVAGQLRRAAPVCSPPQGLDSCPGAAAVSGPAAAGSAGLARRATTAAGLSPDAVMWGHLAASAHSAAWPAGVAAAAPALRRKGHVSMAATLVDTIGGRERDVSHEEGRAAMSDEEGGRRVCDGANAGGTHAENATRGERATRVRRAVLVLRRFAEP